MIQFPAGTKIWLALGRTDMRRGMDGLALQIQETLKLDPHSGHLFVFRGKRGDLLKAIWHDGQGACLFSKRLEKGRFQWPNGIRPPGAAGAARVGHAAMRAGVTSSFQFHGSNSSS